MMIARTSISFAVLFASMALVACDPAKGKTQAQTGEAVATASAAVAPTDASTYTFDNTSSKVEWVGAKVSLKHNGGFKTFNGTVKASPAAPEKGSVEVVIDNASVFSDNEKLTKHLNAPDFFDVAKYPKSTFTSTKIEKGGGGKAGATHTITGNLALRGVTKSVSFPATVKLTGDAAEVDAEFVLNRKDFGIVYPGMADDLINDSVTIKLLVRAKKAG